jgi:hypothetical protein
VFTRTRARSQDIAHRGYRTVLGRELGRVTLFLQCPADAAGMAAIEEKTPKPGAKSAPMLGCRRESSTIRSQRSRRIKRLQRRLAVAFSADVTLSTT